MVRISTEIVNFHGFARLVWGLRRNDSTSVWRIQSNSRIISIKYSGLFLHTHPDTGALSPEQR